MKRADILKRADLWQSREAFVKACAYSRHWDAVMSDALRIYGSQGAHISGCGREHFPEGVKDMLRKLAISVTVASDYAYDYRPRGVRVETIRKLGRAVAKRDGSGFYGPRA